MNQRYIFICHTYKKITELILLKYFIILCKIAWIWSGFKVLSYKLSDSPSFLISSKSALLIKVFKESISLMENITSKSYLDLKFYTVEVLSIIKNNVFKQVMCL